MEIIKQILGLFGLFGGIMSRIWPNRETWRAECLPPTAEEPNRGDPRLNPRAAFDRSSGIGRWSQMREMRFGDYYRLDIGKPRLLSKIQFVTEGKDFRYPKRYRLEVKRDERSDMCEIGEFDGPIDALLNKPQKIQIIKITIIEPMLEPKGERGTPAWSIYDIRLAEPLLFGKWCERTI